MSKDNNIHNNISDAFESFRVQPSKTVYTRISKKIFFINLYHFHLAKIIIGTISLSIIIAILYFFSNNFYSINTNEYKKIKKEAINEKTIISENTTNAINSNEKGKITKHLTYKKQNTKEKFSVSKTDNQQANTIKPNDINNISENKVIKPQIILTQKYDKIIEDGISQNLNNRQQISTNTNLNYNIQNTDLQNSTNIVTENYYKTTSNKSILDENNYRENIELISKLNPDLKFSKETLSLYQPIIDSTYIKQYLKSKNFWTFDIFWNPSISKIKFSTHNIEYEYLTNLKNYAFKETISYNSYGLKIGMNKKNIIYQAGITYSEILEKYNYKLILNNPTEKINLQYNNTPFDFEFNNNFFNIDTIGGYYHFTFVQDSIIHVFDSVWVDITDTIQVNIYDTLKYTVYDSLLNQNYINKYTFIEIPLSIGYKFQHQNIDISLNGGIVAGILIKNTGNNISEDMNYIQLPINQLSNKMFNFAGMISLNINYNLTEKLGLWIEPTYKKFLFSSYQKNYLISKKYDIYSLKLGLKLKF